LLILIGLASLGAAKAKNKRTFEHHLLQKKLMDDHQTLSVAFLGSP
jgi:hypothetical protein